MRRIIRAPGTADIVSALDCEPPGTADVPRIRHLRAEGPRFQVQHHGGGGLQARRDAHQSYSFKSCDFGSGRKNERMKPARKTENPTAAAV